MYNKNQDKMTQEQLRMQMLAGIITEGQYKAKLNEEDSMGGAPERWKNLNQNPSSDFVRFYYNEKDNTFVFKPDDYNLDLVFSYDGNTLSADFPYLDYGSNREEGEAVLDPVIDSLENVLASEGIKYEILTLSYQYKFKIYI
jgi:hypothetical protein